MKAYRCDRCGKFFEGFPYGKSCDATWMYKLKLILFHDNAANRQVLPITFPKKTTLETEKETIDLCPYCVKDFAVWLTKTEYNHYVAINTSGNTIGFSSADEVKEEETSRLLSAVTAAGKAYNVRMDYGVEFGKWSPSNLNTIKDPESTFSSYDLCENCAYAFMKWFNKPSYRKDVRVVKRNNGFFNFEQKPKEETT